MLIPTLVVLMLLYSYAQLQGLLLLATYRWNRLKMDPEPKVPTLLYIDRRGRVTERAIGLTDYFLVCYTIFVTERS
jgi:hypothetical protein